MYKKYSSPQRRPLLTICYWLLAIGYSAIAQTPTQTVRGTVVDLANHRPLNGASVKVIGTEKGTNTNEKGEFSIPSVAIGRYNVQISFIGYETLQIPEILVEASKEKILEIALKPQATQLDEAVVRTAQPVAQSSIQSITTEQTLRYAATFFDPARLATSFAGVANANDQANNLVVRGNSPIFNQWRLEGVEIVNPNHLSNAGTFSDRPTQAGGGVNILSTQLMDKADFLTGAYPAEYGNALGAIMDVRLRKGNNQRHEFTAQAGLIGIDLAAEGPISRKKGSSYLVNYRYSFTGLLASMGVTFGGEDIRFQDLSFNLSFPTQKAGNFTVFGMGGMSSNIFKAEKDSSTTKFEKDLLNIDFNNKMGAVGITHELNLGKNTTWHTVGVASGLRNNRFQTYLFGDAGFTSAIQDNYEKGRYSLATSITKKANANWQYKAGLNLTRQHDYSLNSYQVTEKTTIDANIVEPYITVNGRITPKLSTQFGLHYLKYTYDGSDLLEPRASLQYNLSKNQNITVAYGLHSQIQIPQVYVGRRRMQTIIAMNFGNTLTMAKKFVLGYNYTLQNNASLHIELYQQSTTNAALDFGNFPSILDYEAGTDFLSLSQGGTGENKGVEATFQQFLTKNYYLLVTGSVYSSTYKGYDGMERNTRFAGGHTFSVTGGKEFHKKANKIWGINGRILWIGGFRDTPIDLANSKLSNTTVYDYAKINSIKMADYFRPDVRVYWKKNKNGYTRTWSIDIQNISNTENESYSYYDTRQKAIVKRYQLGMIPLLNYRVEF